MIFLILIGMFSFLMCFGFSRLFGLHTLCALTAYHGPPVALLSCAKVQKASENGVMLQRKVIKKT